MSIAEKIAIICIIELVYVFIGYPIILRILSVFFSKPLKTVENYTPALDIVIAAYNEEKLIEGAVRSIFENNYPPELINVWVGNDGSSDKTQEILAALRQEFPALSVVNFPRTGKNGVLNALLLKTGAEITVFMDADVRVLPGSLTAIAEKFSDESVGAVIGEMTFERIGENAGTQGESLYKRYEKFLKTDESRIYTTVTSNGPFYAVPSKLLKPIPNNKVCDDYLPLLRVGVMGKRIIFEKKAAVVEVREKDSGYEFTRIARFASGGLASIKEVPYVLFPLPNHGWFSFFLWSHKILRWFSPFFLFALFLASLWSSSTNSTMLVLCVFQIFFYSLAAIGSIAERFEKNFPIVTFCYFFVLMNIGMMRGVFQFLKSAPTARWEPSQN